MVEKKNKKNCPEIALIDAIYIHIPFCEAKCRYCGFYSEKLSSKNDEIFASALLADLKAQQNLLAPIAKTIYIGGGTPSAIGSEYLDKILSKLDQFTSDKTEFTIEANPNSCSKEFVNILAAHKVNRVSLGVQSFSDSELTNLGRIHKASDISQAVKSLRMQNIANLSLDLIYGLPDQTLASWKENLHRAIELSPDHISCYSLTIDPNTQFEKLYQAGKLELISDSLYREMFYCTIETLRQAGYQHYEISNFAKPGMQSRHNRVYWKNQPYLGLGPAAASYYNFTRTTNSPDLESYISCINANISVECESETLTGKSHAAESLMLNFRLIEGVDISEFVARFGASPEDLFPKSFAKYFAMNILKKQNGKILVETDWLFVIDSLLADILSEAD